MAQSSKNVILITGARGGLGTAATVGLAHLGDCLALLSQGWSEIKEQTEELESSGKCVLGFGIDLTSASLVATAVDRIVEEAGIPTVVMHCASAVGPIAPLHLAKHSEWDQAVSSNVTGSFNIIREVIGRMITNNGGTIITVATEFARTPHASWSAYCASKAALLMLTGCIDAEYRSENIRAYSILPGKSDTDMRVARGHQVSPKGQSPEYAADVVKVAAWLATDSPEEYLGGVVDVDCPQVRKQAGL